MNTKKKILFFLLIIFVLSITACASKADDVAVAVALTQTATAPIEEPSPEVALGSISGVAGVFAPPTPPLTIYVVNIENGEWFSVDTPEAEMEASFSIEVPSGAYQLFAFEPGLGYSIDGKELSLITVKAGETVTDIRLAVPGPSDCGPMFGIPASPDGKYAEVNGATADCLASLSVDEAEEPAKTVPQESALMQIQFAPGDDSTQVFGTLPAGWTNHYVLGAAAGQEMTVSLDAFDGNSTTLAISGADGTILNQYDTSSPLWIGNLPKTQDYYIDILSSENVDIDYALVVAITTPEQTNDTPDTVVYGGVTGSTNYPETTSPPMHIIVTERATGLWYWIGTAENAGAYTMPELPPSSYTIRAYTQSGLSGGYVDANGSFLPVSIGSAELVEGIDLSWWAPIDGDNDPVGW